MYKKLILTLVLSMLTVTAQATPEYDKCYSAATDDDATATCMKEETARLMKEIQQKYLQISEMPLAQEWNNGDGLKKGNLRDMYNSWLAYRNRLCSLNKKLSVNGYGSEEFHYASCMLDMTKSHMEYIDAVITTALASTDDPNENY